MSNTDNADDFEKELAFYAQGRRNSIKEKALTQSLRELPEHERLRLVTMVSEHSIVVSFVFAKATLSNTSVAKLVELTLTRANVHTSFQWIDLMESKFGRKKAIAVLLKLLTTRDLYSKFEYNLLRKADDESQIAIRSKRHEIFSQPLDVTTGLIPLKNGIRL